jgi:hypothetical protein
MLLSDAKTILEAVSRTPVDAGRGVRQGEHPLDRGERIMGGSSRAAGICVSSLLLALAFGLCVPSAALAGKTEFTFQVPQGKKVNDIHLVGIQGKKDGKLKDSQISGATYKSPLDTPDVPAWATTATSTASLSAANSGSPMEYPQKLTITVDGDPQPTCIGSGSYWTLTEQDGVTKDQGQAIATSPKLLSFVFPGSDVPADFGDGTGLLFSHVTVEGTVTVAAESGVPAPLGYHFPTGDYAEISATAAFDGHVAVTLPYDPGVLSGDESKLRLFHYVDGSWHDITIAVDTSAHTITGVADSLSPFGIGEQVPATSTPASSSWSLALGALAGLGVTLAMRKRRTAFAA